MHRKMLLWLCLAIPLAACAGSGASQRPPEDAPRPPPEIKSSIAVLIDHRAELSLTTEQLGWLQGREEQLQKENAPLKKKVAEAFGRGGEGGRYRGGGHRGGMGGGGMGGGMGGGRMRGGMGGMGGGMGGGYMGGGMGGPRGEGGGREGGQDPEARRERMAQARSAMREMQDNDSRAYNEAETQLTDAQKPRARELVSQEREKWLQQREAMRKQMDGEGT